MAAKRPAADDMNPAAEPAVCAVFVSNMLSRFPNAANAENPSTAEMMDAPNDQPIFRPM